MRICPTRLSMLFLNVSRLGPCQAARADTTDDEVIWRFARDNGFALLTQDSDFERKAALRGAPPKVVLVRTGNIRTPLLRPIVAAHIDRIERFLASATEVMLYLPRPRSLWSDDDPSS